MDASRTVNTLATRFDELTSERPERAAMWYRRRIDWGDVTWAAWREQVRQLAVVMRSWGVQEGEHVAVMARSRYEWIVIDQALAALGAISLSLPVTFDTDAVHRALEVFEVRVAFVEDPELLEHFLRSGKPLRALTHLIYFEARSPERAGGPPVMLDDVAAWPPDPRLESLDIVFEQPLADVAQLPDTREQVATVVFTSGTAGTRSAVAITHQDLRRASAAITEAYQLTSTDVVMVALPLSLLFGRLFAYATLQAGATLALGDRLNALVDHMSEVQPTVVVAAPLVFERMTSRMSADATTASPLRRALFSWALETGRQASVERQNDGARGPLLSVKLGIANRLVFRRMHESFGSRLRFFVSAGGALSKSAAEFFHSAGVLVLESYGQTETGGLIAANLPDGYRFGSVGRVLPGIEWQLGGEGTLQLRAPWQPALPLAGWSSPHTAPKPSHHREPDDAPDAGWWDTDDLARVDEEGFLYVDGRRAEQITLDSGEVVHPRGLEHALRAHPMIINAAVFGEGKPFVSALLILDHEVTRRWADEHGVTVAPSELYHDQRVFQKLSSIVEAACQPFPTRASVQKFALLDKDIGPRTGELTEHLEVRRGVLSEQYGRILRSFYAEAF